LEFRICILRRGKGFYLFSAGLINVIHLCSQSLRIQKVAADSQHGGCSCPGRGILFVYVSGQEKI
jgi:hypothetical protein